MELTKIFLNNSKYNFGNDFDKLSDLFSAIQEQSMGFYQRLIRYISMTIDEKTAIETGFRFADKEGIPEDKDNDKKRRDYISFLTGMKGPSAEQLSKKEHYNMTKTKSREKYFIMAFNLKLNSEQTNIMFNKLFAQPAFIREPDSLIYMYCLDKYCNDKEKGFNEAKELVEKYYNDCANSPEEEKQEDKNTFLLFRTDINDENAYIDFLVKNKSQFTVSNVSAINKIKETVDKYSSTKAYIYKLAQIEENILYGESLEVAWNGVGEPEDNDENMSAEEKEAAYALAKSFILLITVLSKDAPVDDEKISELINAAITDISELPISDEERLNYIKAHRKTVLNLYVRKCINSIYGERAKKINELSNLSDEELLNRILNRRNSELRREILDKPIMAQKEKSVIENEETKMFIDCFDEEMKCVNLDAIKTNFLNRAFYKFPDIKMLYSDKFNGNSNGKYTRYEDIRKILIMVSFLDFCLEEKNATFTDYINLRLQLCNFPALYAPNPFDFVFMLAGNSDDPIKAFKTIWEYAFSQKR